MSELTGVPPEVPPDESLIFRKVIGLFRLSRIPRSTYQIW